MKMIGVLLAAVVLAGCSDSTAVVKIWCWKDGALDMGAPSEARIGIGPRSGPEVYGFEGNCDSVRVSLGIEDAKPAVSRGLALYVDPPPPGGEWSSFYMLPYTKPMPGE